MADTNLKQTLNRMAEAMRKPDLKAVAIEVQTLLENQIQESFANRQDPDREKWKRLRGKSRSKGDMMASALASIAGGTVGDDGFTSANYLVFYWKWQNGGMKKQHIPARPFWGIGKKVIDLAQELAVLELNAFFTAISEE